MAIPELSSLELDKSEYKAEQAYIPPSNSPYEHFRIELSSSMNEQEENIVRQARAAHAIGYRRAGFITDEAIGPDGFLVPEIDTARDYRPMVKYLAVNNNDPADVATATIMGPPEAGDYSSLPSMKLVWSNITQHGHDLITGYLDRGYDIKDVSSLSGTKTPHSVRDILRRTIHQGHIANIEGSNPEVWVFALVTGTHKALEASLTPETFSVLGDDHSFGSSHLVTPGTKLRPLIADPSTVIDNIYRSLEDSVNEGDAKSVRRFTESLRFYSDGLPDEYLSSEVSRWRRHDSALNMGRSALSNYDNRSKQ